VQRESRLNEINYKSKRVEGREEVMKWEFSNIGRSKQEEQSMKNFQDN
jgi:hypothetical protein